VSRPTRARNLPKIADAAWHGAVGEAVIRIAPSTEADPAAVLFQTLALFGAMAGPGPHVVIGAKRHPAQLWPLIVGRTSTARKGTALGEAKAFAETWSTYAKGYVRGRVMPGMSTGEGLLYALGAQVPVRGKGEDQPAVEPAAPDGRLTVAETEFVNVLAMFKREGNNLGGILRQMWDDGRGSTMTRSNPLRVDQAHLVVIGHISPGELRAKLADSDVVGGTANRFLFCAAERPQLLPYEQPGEALGDLAAQLGDYLERTRTIDRRFYRDRAADALWRDVYYALNADEHDGRLGAVLARGPAYTMRLALTYALADGAGAIGVDHLLAGLACWHYAADSARAVFGTDRRDDIDRLAEYIAGAHSRTGTEIYNFFKRNKSRAEIQAMLGQLIDRGDVGEDIDKATGGRPVTRFMWVGAPRDAVEELLEQHRFAPPSTP
jgi:hypothetical protein